MSTTANIVGAGLTGLVLTVGLSGNSGLLSAGLEQVAETNLTRTTSAVVYAVSIQSTLAEDLRPPARLTCAVPDCREFVELPGLRVPAGYRVGYGASGDRFIVTVEHTETGARQTFDSETGAVEGDGLD